MKGIRKGMRVKQENGTPTFYTSLLEREEFINVYINVKKSGLPYIFEEMRSILESRGLTQYQAALESKKAWDLFTEASMNLSSKDVYPFYLRIRPIDKSKVLNSK